jgi:hypothetical protein
MKHMKRAFASILHYNMDVYQYARFILEGVAEASQIFLPDAQVLSKLLRYMNTADVTGSKPITV